MYTWLKFGRKVLLYVLSTDIDAKVEIPTLADVAFYKEANGVKYTLILDIWGTYNVFESSIQELGRDYQQNKFYNGWTHGCYINSVFIFSPDDKIHILLLKNPGITITGYGIYEAM